MQSGRGTRSTLVTNIKSLSSFCSVAVRGERAYVPRELGLSFRGTCDITLRIMKPMAENERDMQARYL
jgi:hypothetical protein